MVNIEKLLQLKIKNLRSFQDQKMWCEDWEEIEILKCKLIGEKQYRIDPIPNRAKENPFFDMERIIEGAKTWCIEVVES